MTCKDCGTQNYAGSLYCKKCGADLNRKATETPVTRKGVLQILLSALR
ncbi:MAG: zinc-ribbon domain-containing protein [Bacillota bacterium]